MIKRIIVFGYLTFMFPVFTMQPEQGLIKKLKLHNGRITSVSFVDNTGNRILSSSVDGTVKITDKNSGHSSLIIPNLGQVVGATLMDNKTVIAVGSSKSQTPQFYSLNGQFISGGNSHQSPITALLLLNDISVVTGAQNGSVIALFKEGRRAAVFNVGGAVVALAKTSSTQILALTSGSLSWLDAANQGTLWRNNQINGGLSVAAVGSNRWAIGLSNGSITVFDSSTGNNVMRSLNGHKQAVYALSAFQDPYLISAAGDGMIKMWDASTGQELASVNPNMGPIFSLATQYDQQTGLLKTVAGSGEGEVAFYAFSLNAAESKHDDRPAMADGVYAALGIKKGASPFEILGLNSSRPSLAEIKKAYREKVTQWHPDKNKSELAKDVFQLISWAYEKAMAG